MALYFFAAYHDERLVIDEFGLELDSLEEVEDQAAAMLPDLARDKLPDGEYHEFMCHVKDQQGRPVYRGRLIYEGEQMADEDEETSSRTAFGIVSLF